MPAPLSIVHVITSLDVGGAERVVLDLAATQTRRGHRVTVVSLAEAEGPMGDPLRLVVDRLEKIPKRGAGFDRTLILRLARYLRRKRADVVHTHNNLPLIYGAPAGKLAGARVVHTKHGEHAVGTKRMMLRRAAATMTDAYVAVSEATAGFAKKHRECAPDKLRTVINGTDMTRFPAGSSARAEVRRGLGISEGARVVITVGRIVWEKNHRHLLAAADPLLGSERRLVVVGDGPLRGELEAAREALTSRDFVQFTGPRSDVPALLAAADAFVLSSDTEGLPICLLEAMAAGLPIVTTAVGGIPAVIDDGVTGLLVPPKDVPALRAALARALDGGADLAAMAARAREKVLATYSAEGMTDAYFRVYADVDATVRP